MSGDAIKRMMYTYNPEKDLTIANIPPKNGEPIIKRYRVNYTVQEKVRLGMLPYSALEEYERQQAEEERLKQEEESSNQEDSSKEKTGASHGKTFWEDDDGEREMLSEADYQKFLEENSIKINTVDDIIAGMQNQ